MTDVQKDFMLIEETTFKNKPILVIRDDEGKRILFSAGLKKIKTILANVVTLQSFAEKYNKE